MSENTVNLSAASLKVLHQLAEGVSSELVNLTALRALERLGYVAWSTEGRYTRVLTSAGRERAEQEAETCA